jgi:hypothetical protein
MRWGYARKTRNVYKLFVRKYYGNRPVAKSSRRWKGNVEILKLILSKQNLRMWSGLMWLRIGTSCGLLGNMVMNLQVP